MQPSGNRSLGENELYEEFLCSFLKSQYRIFAYILALVQDRGDAEDVFQETSLIIWREFASFDPDREFAPWALGIAKNQVLKFWRSRKQDRHIFSEVLIQQLAEDAMDTVLEREPRKRALRECIQDLTDRQKQLIEQFYGRRREAAVIAESWNRSVFTVYKSLKSLRKTLLQCIQRKLAEEQVV